MKAVVSCKNNRLAHFLA